MGLFNSHEQKIIPLEVNQGTVNMFEVEQLSHRIQSTINQCHFERELIKNKYGINPDTVELSSCMSTFKYYGNHHQTFELLSNRFKGRTKTFELQIKPYPDEDVDYLLYTGTTFFWERSTIKIIV